MDGAPSIRHLETGLSSPAYGGSPFTDPPQTGPRGVFPMTGWPAKHDLEYLKILIELALLLLAVPWLLARLAHNPKATSRRAADAKLRS